MADLVAEAPPPPAPAMPKAVAPPVRVAGLRFSPSRFALGHGRGSLVRFSLSAASPIEITFARKVAGRQTTRGCIPASRPAGVPKGRRCTAQRFIGTVAGAGEPGANQLAFDGHVGPRLLPAGAYAARVIVPGVGSSNTAGLEVMRHGPKDRH